MDEYVALVWPDEKGDELGFVRQRTKLMRQGWQEYIRVPWSQGIGFGSAGACIMRRPKDEPRKWTRTQIEDIALNMVLKHEEWGDRPNECPDLDIEAAKEARGNRD